MTEFYTAEFYRAKPGEDLVLQHRDEAAAREYLRQIAAVWRAEGYLVSCAATEEAPGRVTGQWPKPGAKYKELWIERRAWIVTWCRGERGLIEE